MHVRQLELRLLADRNPGGAATAPKDTAARAGEIWRKKLESFEAPPWLGAEVTHDARYFNSNLATAPYSTWLEAADRK